jgi:2-phosphosulfolactate phosphatase
MFDQSPYECRVEWGVRGAREAAERGDITIIVDVLSFSSAVVTAVHYGAIIYPHPKNDQVHNYAKKMDLKLILGRAEAAKIGIPTLSPISFGPEHKGQKFVLSSLNGAACSWIATQVPALLIGCLLNASSVANAANQLQSDTGANITVIACGEQWNDVRNGENQLRPSIEDYLGAGAILHQLIGSKSPEAEVCNHAFQSTNHKIQQFIWDSGSGRELRQRGFENDVIHCSRLDHYSSAPKLMGNHFRS